VAFSTPYIFLNGSDLLASSLDADYQGARDYLNAEIVPGDLQSASFDGQALAESTQVGGGRRFVTGNTYGYSALVDDTVERAYSTGTVKTSDITQQVLYLSLPGASQIVTLESTGALLIEAMGYVVVPAGDASSPYKALTSPTPSVVDSRFYLRIDGQVVANSRSYHFTEEAGPPSAQSIATNVSGFATGTAARRPLFLFHVERGLSAGHHTVEVVCDVRSELLFLGPVSIQCECLPDGGYTSYTGTETFME